MGSVQTVALSGFNRDDETTLRTWFDQVNKELGEPFALIKDLNADVLIIDIDSIYGQMDWLRAQSTGRCIVAHTSGAGTDARYRLPRPLSASGVEEVMRQLLRRVEPTCIAANGASQSSPLPATPTQTPPPERVESAEKSVAHAVVKEDTPPSTDSVTATQSLSEPKQDRTVAISDASQDAATQPVLLVDYLQTGALDAAVAYPLQDGQRLILDPASQTYIAGPTLKSLLSTLTQAISSENLARVEKSQLERLRKDDPAEHSWMRLLWLAALHAGKGDVIGFGPEQTFKLVRWPQIEREFPRHFRIATAMMRQAGTVEMIATQSGSPANEVADLINAYLVTGHVEAEGADKQRLEDVRAALWGRLRVAA